ncbi:MAG TPA: hypothetical protein VFJ16_22470 [Longimicrobium sp.]|nr:hypothetical protein [Longimicrobium sp.]
MKKLKLDLDALAVDSYATQATEQAVGTVAAHSEPVAVTYVVGKTVVWTVAATEAVSWIC